MSGDESHQLSPRDEKRLLELTVVVIVVLAGVVAVASWLLWDPESKRPTPFIMWVPCYILEWAFAGGMISVLVRLAYRRDIKTVGLELYIWVLAKPFIGLFMGSLIYFVALAVAKLLTDAQMGNALWLNVVAFVGGYSDELSIGLIKRFVVQRLGLGEHADIKSEE